MSNDKNPFERLLRLETKVNELILNGGRDIEPVLDFLQEILDTRPPQIITEEESVYPGSEQPFVAREHLKVDTSGQALLPISGLGEEMKWFIDKVEEPLLGTTLVRYKFRTIGLDGKTMIAELGGDIAAETSLQEMFHFLASAKKTTSPSSWYVFLVRSTDGRLYVLKPRWSDNGWVLAGWDARSWFSTSPKDMLIARKMRTA